MSSDIPFLVPTPPFNHSISGVHNTFKITKLGSLQTAAQSPVKTGYLEDMFFYKVTPCVTVSDPGSQAPQVEQETGLFERKSTPSNLSTILASRGRSSK